LLARNKIDAFRVFRRAPPKARHDRPRFGHGFIALTTTSGPYISIAPLIPSRGEARVALEQPGIGIAWPSEPHEISDKDRKQPDLDPKLHGLELMRVLR
jgi:dTDP-4-dehydrorhamnose 3,5-epimerase-like enzyme